MTADEAAGIVWWNSLAPVERARALLDAAPAGGNMMCAADAWAHYKQTVRTVLGVDRPVVCENGDVWENGRV